MDAELSPETPSTPAREPAGSWPRWLLNRCRALFHALGSVGRPPLANAIIEAFPDAVLVLTAEGRVVQANGAAAGIFACHCDQLVGKILEDLLHPVAGPEIPALLPALLAQQTHPGMTDLQLEVRHPGGESLPVGCRLRALDGRDLLCAFIQDLSPLRHREQAIQRQREAYYRSEKLSALGSLLAGVGHELNNPLSVVLGRSAMLGEQVDDPVLRHGLGRIHQAAERCSAIVRTFLTMARHQAPRLRPTRINTLLTDTLALLEHGIEHHGIEVELELDPALPDIPADGDQLGQVFLNLLSNAQQALEGAPLPRSLRIASFHDHRERRVQIMVSDSGPGIPDRLQTRIFDPYFTTKPMGMGTGVGLSICLSIVTAHRGTLEVDRAAEGGAQFLITLPSGRQDSGPTSA